MKKFKFVVTFILVIGLFSSAVIFFMPPTANGQNNDMHHIGDKQPMPHITKTLVITWKDDGAMSLGTKLNELSKKYTIVQVVPTEYIGTTYCYHLSEAIILLETK